MKDREILGLVLIVVLLTLTLSLFKTINQKEKGFNDLLESLNSELVVWKDKDSLNRAKIKTIETFSTKEFLKLKTSDSLILDLQKTVKEFKKYLDDKGNVTNFGTKTDIVSNSETIVKERDTIKKDSLIYLYPEYRGKFDLDGWVIGEVISNKDTTLLSVEVFNDYSVILGEKSKGLFKGKEAFVEIINKNPYTNTTNLRTYQVSPPRPSRFGVGPNINVGLGSNGKISTSVGIGLQYSILQF